MQNYQIHIAAIACAVAGTIVAIWALWKCDSSYETDERRRYRRTAIVAGAVVLAAIVAIGALWTQTASFARLMRTQRSNYDGGLMRTVTVYDNAGGEIRSWSGRIDIASGEADGETMFDTEDGRVIIEGGIVIIEEIAEN